MICDDRQRARLCRALLRPLFRHRVGALFTAVGPTTYAIELHEQSGALSSGERLMLQVAFAIWWERDGPTVGDLLARLDVTNLVTVSDVLYVIAEGPAAIDEWLDDIEADDLANRERPSR